MKCGLRESCKSSTAKLLLGSASKLQHGLSPSENGFVWKWALSYYTLNVCGWWEPMVSVKKCICNSTSVSVSLARNQIRAMLNVRAHHTRQRSPRGKTETGELFGILVLTTRPSSLETEGFKVISTHLGNSFGHDLLTWCLTWLCSTFENNCITVRKRIVDLGLSVMVTGKWDKVGINYGLHLARWLLVLCKFCYISYNEFCFLNL